MAESTAIEWCDHTFNPWVGCTKIGPGCDHCYAEGWAKRAGTAAGVVWGGARRRTSDRNWRQVLTWNEQAAREGRRFKVFCSSLADVFDNQVPDQWRADLWRLILATPHLDWLLLSKRIGNANAMLQGLGDTLPNVWIGATICNQAEADRDVPKLLATPAAVRFLSVEPMLGPVRLDMLCTPTDRVIVNALSGKSGIGCETRLPMNARGIDWVICGGESGPQSRPMHPDWARSLRDQCASAGVPFLFKQWGEWACASTEPIHPEAVRLPGNMCRIETPGKPDRYSAVSLEGRTRYRIERIGKKAAGRLLDGRTYDEFPRI